MELNKNGSEPKLVAIGGGTGLSTMLRGLKTHTSQVTAVVTVADDGGGSGDLRNDLGMLPPGDIRNCILGLAANDTIMAQLLSYRFTDGRLKGQSFGNLFLAAMCGISDNFEEAVQRVSEVLRVKGRVLPVTLTDVNLEALFDNGAIVTGESFIPKYARDNGTRIKKIRLLPENAPPLPDVIEAIGAADLIIMGPGSLYTSILPNLLVPGVADAVRASAAKRVFVCNIMTQPGETTDMDAYMHIKALYRHVGDLKIDCCIANDRQLTDDCMIRYNEDGAVLIGAVPEEFASHGIKLITGNYCYIHKGKVRHNYHSLASTLIALAKNR